MPKERPFILLGSHALQTVADRLRNALHAWSGQWCANGQGIEVSAAPACAPVEAPLLKHFSDGTADVWISASDERRQATIRCVLGQAWAASHSLQDDWSREVVVGAQENQCHVIAASLLLREVRPHAEPSALPTSLFAPGSGAISLECKALGLRIWACRQVLRHVPPRASAQPKTALQPLAACLSGHRVSVTALAGMVTLEADQLLDLAPGDVLRIGNLADATAQLRLTTGMRLAECTLGQHAGMRALRLVERSSTN